MLNIGYSCSPVTIAQTDSLYGNCSSTVANIPLSHAETTWPWCVSQEVLWRWKLPTFSLSRFRKTPKPARILRPPKNLENIGTCPKCRKSLLVAQPKVYTVGGTQDLVWRTRRSAKSRLWPRKRGLIYTVAPIVGGGFHLWTNLIRVFIGLGIDMKAKKLFYTT